MADIPWSSDDDWDEILTGTCVILQLMSLQRNTKHVIFYSDACADQNKNQVIATCLMYPVTTLQISKQLTINS